MAGGSADDEDDIIDNAKTLKENKGEFFDTEVTAFIKNTQGYDDLVKKSKERLNLGKGFEMGRHHKWTPF